MYPTAFILLIFTFVTTLTKSTYASTSKHAAGQAYWVNGDFHDPYKTGWFYDAVGARFSRIHHRGPNPNSPPSNYVLKVGPIHCHIEAYSASAYGKIIRTLPGKRYKISFEYFFPYQTDHISWGVSYFRTDRDPSLVYFTHNNTFARTAKAKEWYRWTGEFKKPKRIGNSDIRVEVDFNTCPPGFKGPILVDNFQINEI